MGPAPKAAGHPGPNLEPLPRAASAGKARFDLTAEVDVLGQAVDMEGAA